MRLRSVRGLDASRVLVSWFWGVVGVGFVSNEIEHSSKLVDREFSLSESRSMVWAKEASSCTA